MNCANCKTEIFFTEFSYAIVPICVPRKDKLSKNCDRTLGFIKSLHYLVDKKIIFSKLNVPDTHFQLWYDIDDLREKIEEKYNLFGIKSIDVQHFSRKYELIDLIESFEKAFTLWLTDHKNDIDDIDELARFFGTNFKQHDINDKKLEKFIDHLLDNKDDAFQEEPNKGSYITDLLIFDLDNTLRYEIDDTPIEHGINLFNKVLNKENTEVYIASCNRKQSVVTWVENNKYTDKVSIHAPICGGGFKDLTSVVETFNDLNIDENANKFVIGDTFKDMDSIRRVKDKFSGNGLQNWYFIRSYFKSEKLVKEWFKNNPDWQEDPNSDWYKWEAVFPFDTEEKFYNYNCGDLYFLPDGVLLPNLSEIGVLSADYHNFKDIDLFQNSKEMYIRAEYGNHSDYPQNIDSAIENKYKNSFKVAILGRYFRTKVSSMSNPSTISSVEIINFKNGAVLSDNLTSSLNLFFKEQLENFPEKGAFQDGNGGYFFKPKENNIIITSVPNSDGGNRFSDYLLELKNKIKDIDTELNIFVLDEFITQVGEKVPNHNIRGGVDNKMDNVKGKYAINEKYLGKQEFSSAFVFVIDDVLTSGSTFNEINETLATHGFNFLGVVLGKTQSYPYTDSKGLVSYNYLPLNESAVKEFVSDPWCDWNYVIGH